MKYPLLHETKYEMMAIKVNHHVITIISPLSVCVFYLCVSLVCCVEERVGLCVYLMIDFTYDEDNINAFSNLLHTRRPAQASAEKIQLQILDTQQAARNSMSY